MYDTKKLISYTSDLEHSQDELEEAQALKLQLRAELDGALSNREWSRVADEYARVNATINRLSARIRVLIGRIHFLTGVRPAGYGARTVSIA